MISIPIAKGGFSITFDCRRVYITVICIFPVYFLLYIPKPKPIILLVYRP